MNDILMSCLVIDDSPVIRELLRGALGKRFQVEVAEDGEPGLEAYLASRPDCIFLDLNMPGMGGKECLRYIREQANDQDVYVIVLTANDTPQDMAEALNLGANDFLTKPFHMEVLMARAGSALRHVQLMRQLRQAYERIALDVAAAAELQAKLLPRGYLDCPGALIQAMYHPSGQASGDYYDFFPVGPDTVRVVMADVSGHGVRAAFVMSMIRALVQGTRQHLPSLARTMALINTQMTETLGDEADFVTFFAAEIDFNAHRLSFVNAGHCPGILARPGGGHERLDPQYPPLGFFPLEFEVQECEFMPGAGLFLFTDGLYEWDMGQSELFGFERFWDLAVRLTRERPFRLEGLKIEMEAALISPATYRDDLTALWIEARNPSSGGEICAQPASIRNTVAENQVMTIDEPVSIGMVRPITRTVLTFLREHIGDESILFDCELAMTEALANIAVHGYNGLPGRVMLRVEFRPSWGVSMEIEDWGRDFERKEAVTTPSRRQIHGRGMFIIRALMDEVKMQRRGDRNSLLMLKRTR
ncbi:MAG: response regulator [Deltaproteobacteria bacterium]|nr:response regulator [Deltaproteobacteria bacterium]